MKIERGYFYHDGSCLVNQMHSKGTLLVSTRVEPRVFSAMHDGSMPGPRCITMLDLFLLNGCIDINEENVHKIATICVVTHF